MQVNYSMALNVISIIFVICLALLLLMFCIIIYFCNLLIILSNPDFQYSFVLKKNMKDKASKV